MTIYIILYPSLLIWRNLWLNLKEVIKFTRYLRINSIVSRLISITKSPLFFRTKCRLTARMFLVSVTFLDARRWGNVLYVYSIMKLSTMSTSTLSSFQILQVNKTLLLAYQNHGITKFFYCMWLINICSIFPRPLIMSISL